MERRVICYSESFKLKVVSELESGKLASYSAARELYGIKGCETVQNWLRKYGKNHLLNKVVRVEKADERSEIKKLKSRVRQLEKLVVDGQIDLGLEQAWLEIACETAGIEDVFEFKKKHGFIPSENSTKKTRRKK